MSLSNDEIERKLRWLELVAKGHSPAKADYIMRQIDRVQSVGILRWIRERYPETTGQA